MNERQAAIALMALGAAAAVALLIAPRSPLAAGTRAAEGWQGTTWAPRKPRKPYYCRGGLFHPPVAGEGRTGLLRHGWDWIAEPPSEDPGPGVTDE